MAKKAAIKPAELAKKIKPAYSVSALKKSGISEQEIKYLKNYKIFPIDILRKAPWNYKEEDEYKSVKLKNNIERIGQVENIQVRELEDGFYEVVNGNHRLEDMLALGKKWVMAYDHGQISREEAKRIAIETNETRFPHDIGALAGILKELDEHFGTEDLEVTMPYTPDEFQDLIDIPNFDFTQYDNRLTPDELDEKKAKGNDGVQPEEDVVVYTLTCSQKERKALKIELDKMIEKFTDITITIQHYG